MILWMAMMAHAEALESSTLALVGGGSPPSHWAVGIRGGYPSLGVQVQTGLSHGWTPLFYADTQLFRREWVGVGMGKRWEIGRAHV